MNKEQILLHLDFKSFYQSLVINLKENGKDQAMGLCPFHDDHHPSLSINLSSGLFNCLAGCGGGDVFSFYQKLKGVDFKTALKEIAGFSGVTDIDIKQRVVATFEYKDSDDKTLYIKERIEPDGRRKDKVFVFKHLEAGNWVKGRAHDPVLYNLFMVSRSDFCFVVEGEAKADLLMKWGLVATCLDSGAKSPFKDDYLKHFEGKKKIIILPDNDTPGRQYASKIATALHGKVGEIKVVEPPGLKEAEDIIDWARIQGNNKEKLLEIIKASPEWQPSKDEELIEVKHHFYLIRANALLSIEEPETDWLWEGILPAGGLSLLVAKPKVGKTTLALNLAVAVSRGDPFLDKKTQRGAVIYLALEEKRGEVQKKLKALTVVDEPLHFHFGPAPIEATKEVEALIKETGAKLLVVDVFQKFARVRDMNDYAIVTRSLEPIMNVARQYNCHIVLTHHAGKADRPDGDDILGSTALLGGVDTSIHLKKRDTKRTFFTIQRYGENIPETVLTLNPDGSLEATGSREEVEIDETIPLILEALKDGPLTEKDIWDRVEKSHTLVAKVLRRLVEQARIERTGSGRRGDPYQYSLLLSSVYIEESKREMKSEDNSLKTQGLFSPDDFQKNETSQERIRRAFLTSEEDKAIDLTGIDFEVIE